MPLGLPWLGSLAMGSLQRLVSHNGTTGSDSQRRKVTLRVARPNVAQSYMRKEPVYEE